jgi:formaldehyde-activating enzyme involved in methanogenesis
MVDHKDTKFCDPDMTKQRELYEDNKAECATALHCRLWKTSDLPDVHKILYKKIL